MFETLQNWIVKFNDYTETNHYRDRFWNLAIVIFAVSYILQYINDKNCGVFNECLRVVHHFVIFFIYFGFLAPTNTLPFMVMFSISAIFSWFCHNNNCVLSMIEQHLCKFKKGYRFHDLPYFVDMFLKKWKVQISVDNFIIEYRTVMVLFFNAIIFLRLYTWFYTSKEDEKKDLSTFQIHGHRGARWIRPENSLSAFDYATSIGVDALELDLQITKDNVIVINHDQGINFQNCSNGLPQIPNKIKELTLEEVKKYNCEMGEKIPTLNELLQWLANSKYANKNTIKINMEIKTTAETDTDEEVEKVVNLVLKILRERNLPNEIIIQSFDPRALEKVKKADSSMKLSLLIEDPSIDMINLAKKLKVDIISPEYTLLSKPLVQKMHEEHFQVLPWVIDSTYALQRMLDMNVDGVISDDPQLMINYISQLQNSNT